MSYLSVVWFTILIFNFIYSQNKLWPTLADSPWPMIKHNPQFTGLAKYKGPQTATVVWAKDLVDGVFSGPVIGEQGNLYLGSYYQLDSADYFYAYTPTGDIVWDYKLGTNRPPQSGILIDSSNTIYFGALDRYFYALNPNGTLKWRYETSNPIVELAIPNIDLQGKLYFTNAMGELYSINSDGTLNWKVKYESGFYNRSPVFSDDGNTIYIFGVDSNLFALDLDGNIKWKFSFIGSEKAPIVDSLGNIYFDGPNFFYSIFPNGSIRWKFGDFYYGGFSMPTIDKYGNLYTIAVDTTCCPYYKLLISLNNAGDFRWKYTFKDEESDDFWQPLICDSEGTVYVGSTFGNYYYAISSAGELKWKLPLNGYQVDNTGAIAEDGTLYLGVHLTSLHPNQKQTLLAIRDTNVVSLSGDDPVLSSLALKQNYPNPFNSRTKISFTIPQSGHVSLKVFDISGKEVVNLVDGFRFRGEYFELFDDSNLTSGIYVYRLKIGKFTSTKKMILVK